MLQVVQLSFAPFQVPWGFARRSIWMLASVRLERAGRLMVPGATLAGSVVRSSKLRVAAGRSLKGGGKGARSCRRVCLLPLCTKMQKRR